MRSTSRKISHITFSSKHGCFVDQNNNPFFYLADTWWYGGTSRMKFPEPFSSFVKDRKKKGFTVIQIVVGIPPETTPFSKDAENSYGTVFKKNYTLNSTYFIEIDKKIQYLVSQGLVPCIVGGWGHYIDNSGVEAEKMLWNEIIKRYSDYPVIFCLCGEPNLFLPQNTLVIKILQKFQYAVKTFLPQFYLLLKTLLRKKVSLDAVKENSTLAIRINKWREIGEYISKNNKKNIPIISHTGSSIDSLSLFGNPSWLACNTIQSGHDLSSVKYMVDTISENKKKKIPIINMEPWYEGILGNFGEYYQRFAFWTCMLSGATGYAYGAHGVWQMSVNNDFMNHWGESSWQKAWQYNGGTQIGKSATFLKNYNWSELIPVFVPNQSNWQKYFNKPYVARIGKTYFAYLPASVTKKMLDAIVPAIDWDNAIPYNPKTMRQVKNHEPRLNQDEDELLVVHTK